MQSRAFHLPSLGAGALVALALVVLPGMRSPFSGAPAQAAGVGRYVVYSSAASPALLLDTVTGSIWRRVYNKQKKVTELQAYVPGPSETK